MKAKKLVAVGMTVLMLGGLFVGCGNSADTSTGANSGKNVKITIFQSKIEANEGYKKLIAAYEKEQRILLQKTEKYMPFRYTWKVMDSLLISRCLRMLEFL